MFTHSIELESHAANMKNSARHALVSGRVQGVAFRHHAKVRARELGLVGWVRNVADGRVETWFEGPDVAVAEFAAWLQHGPTSARVDGVELLSVEPIPCTRFEVRFD